MDQRGAGTCQGHTVKLGQDRVFSVSPSGVQRRPSTDPVHTQGLPA